MNTLQHVPMVPSLEELIARQGLTLNYAIVIFQVPVETIVEEIVEREVQIERIIERIVEVPVEIERRVEVEVPYEKIVTIEQTVETIVYKDVPVPVQMSNERVVVKEVRLLMYDVTICCRHLIFP